MTTQTYAASKSYIPPFRYVASAAETISSRSGIEAYIRRGLTPSSKRRKPSSPPPSAEPQAIIPQPQPWHQKLYYSSTGLATSLSVDSRKSIKYCLRILFTANTTLLSVIDSLTALLSELESPSTPPSRRSALATSIDSLKDEAIRTLHNVIDTISKYAGGALPEQARGVVKSKVLSFPARWKRGAEGGEGGEGGKARRVLVMAREGLEMMRGVAEVLGGTLESAEAWCERLGRKVDEEESGDSKMVEDGEKTEVEERRAEEGRAD